MDAQPDSAFLVCFVSEAGAAPVLSAAEIVERVRENFQWDEATIVPTQGQFPRMHLSRCADHGFVIHCLENEEALGKFLVVSLELSGPSIEINLGGQALERWPLELFVPELLAVDAVESFLVYGKCDPTLLWVKADAFSRETVWVGRAQRYVWETERRKARVKKVLKKVPSSTPVDGDERSNS